MISNDDTTKLQLAVEAGDSKTFADLIEPQSAQDLSNLQLFSHHTLLMYTCEYGDPGLVRQLLDKGIGGFELEWSDNNELKSALRNAEHRTQILTLLLGWLPEELAQEMISSDWDPDPDSGGQSETPLEMAAKLEDKSCHQMLSQRLSCPS